MLLLLLTDSSRWEGNEIGDDPETDASLQEIKEKTKRELDELAKRRKIIKENSFTT